MRGRLRPTNRGRKLARRPFDRAEVREMIRPPRDHRFSTPLRTRALVAVLAFEKLRTVQEVLDLTVDQLRVLQNDLPPEAQHAIDVWLRERRQLAAYWLTDLAFCTRQGTPLVRANARQQLLRHGRRFGHHLTPRLLLRSRLA